MLQKLLKEDNKSSLEQTDQALNLMSTLGEIMGVNIYKDKYKFSLLTYVLFTMMILYPYFLITFLNHFKNDIESVGTVGHLFVWHIFASKFD